MFGEKAQGIALPGLKEALKMVIFCMEQSGERTFIIIGHRGCVGVGGLGENTIPAFERALQDGADGIEFDVYAVSDTAGNEHLIVMHDDDVRRTTNGEGTVWDLGYERLRELKVGDEKTETADQYEEGVPTAEEVFDLVAKFDKATGRRTLIHIELKGKGTAVPSSRLIRRYLEHGLSLDNFIVSSFDHAQLEEFHELLREVETAVLIDDKQFVVASESLTPAISLAKRLGSTAVSTGISFTRVEHVEQLHSNGLKSYVWTGASQEMVDKADQHVVDIFKLGADGVFANKPGTGRAVLQAIRASR